VRGLRCLALAVVVLARVGAASAQEGATPDAQPPGDTVEGGGAQAVDTPTRRPRRTWTVTASPTSTDTATNTAAPTATRPPPTATASATVPATATPSPTPVALARIFSGGAANAPWFALGGILTLCGVWLGARLGGGRERIARRRARVTQASAMLLELRRLDSVLRRMVALDNPASFPSLDHPIIEAALRDLTLFAPDTAARVAQFHGALRGIQHEIGDYRDNPLRWAGRLSELNQLIKNRAAAACRSVPELMKALEKEGGTPPPHLGEPPAAAAQRDADRLPPPPFPHSDADDWTM
jgi:hypothetical protein